MSGIQQGLIGSLYGAVGDFESIATVTVGAGGSSTITFSSIPSTYTHLQIRALVKNSSSAGTEQWYLQMNGDSSLSSYTGHQIQGDGASATANGVGTGSYNGVGPIQLVGTTATSVFNGLIIDILDYANTNKYKTTRVLGGYDANGSGLAYLTSGLWLSTSAINQVVLWRPSNTIAQYSSFALYGLRA